MAELTAYAESVLGSVYSALGDQPYEQVLNRVQGMVARDLESSAEAMPEAEFKEKIERCITDNGIKCDLTDSVAELTRHIYHDMAGLSFISRDGLFDKPGFEEININAWNDVEISMCGEKEKTDYSFLSPQHAIDIHSRMFRKTKTVFNDAVPRATADIGDGIRITAQKSPVVDADVAVVSSIRKVNMQILSKEALLEGETLTSEMLDFLILCLMHGASICISGGTGAGKTTLAGYLLSIASKTLRTYTIEEGSREWNFVLRDENGKMRNSVIHTRTVPNLDNPAFSIDQEALVKDSLRFDPDIIAPGEIRGREAFEVMGVSNTGHTVLTTTHANGTADTPGRVIALAKMAYDMSDSTLYTMVCRAFPILVHMSLGKDFRRRVTEIREVTGYENGSVQSRMLFAFNVRDSIYEGERCVALDGSFQRLAPISEELAQNLLKKGARRAELAPFLEAAKCS